MEQLGGLLVVLEVGIGTLPSLPPSSLPLPLTVPRLDLELVPSILSKLDQLKDLLTGTPTINGKHFSFRISTKLILTMSPSDLKR